MREIVSPAVERLEEQANSAMHCLAHTSKRPSRTALSIRSEEGLTSSPEKWPGLFAQGFSRSVKVLILPAMASMNERKRRSFSSLFEASGERAASH